METHIVTPADLTALKRELVALLRNYGWEVAEAERPFAHEWWVEEFWTLESHWSPAGKCAWLSFLNDPQNEREVWAVCATVARPESQPAAVQPLLDLGHGWRKDLAGFGAALARFRG